MEGVRALEIEQRELLRLIAYHAVRLPPPVQAQLIEHYTEIEKQAAQPWPIAVGHVEGVRILGGAYPVSGHRKGG